MTIYIVFNKDDEIISIHKNREYAMQIAKDYIRTFSFTEEDLAECLEMLTEDGYVDDLVWIEEHEVND